MPRTDQRNWIAILISACTILFSINANAVPSFARQTGLSCASCHTTYPELTQFGRSFKLNGYTMTGLKQLEMKQKGNQSGMKINEIPPLSMMLTTSITHTSKSQPDQQNNDFSLPQELSLFFAGEITPHIGSFLQATYTQEDDKFSLDNTDIRFANQTTLGGKDTVYGLTLNNSPTVEDLWNSTPVWGFPFLSSDTAPSPAAAPLIEDGLAQDVAGLGGYALWNNHLYGNVTFYRSAHLGGTSSDSSTIKGVAPYWRLAWQQNLGDNYLEVGTFGLDAELYPDGNIEGRTNTYTDIGVDAQYEHPIGSNLLTLRGSYIDEKQKLDAAYNAGDSANSTNKLNKLDLNGTYHLGSKASLAFDAFNISGDTDNGLYSADPVDGSVNGSPDSQGITLEGTYLPWQNTQFSLQYTDYLKFNGRKDNYDGNGRNASDNNTLYLTGWFVW